MGVDPERAAEFMHQHGADIVALNCGTGMDMVRARDAVQRYRSVTDLPLIVFQRAYVLYFVQQFGPSWQLFRPDPAEPAW